jgi:hypothetical protein
MSPVSIRLTETEKTMLQDFAKIYGISLSAAIKKIVFERFEDEYDMRIIDDYKKNPRQKTYSMRQAAAALGIADEI